MFAMSYTVFALSLGFCYGFVLFSSADAGFDENNVADLLFTKGELSVYRYVVTTSSVEQGGENGAKKDVGFRIEAEVRIGAVRSLENEKLLRLEIKSLKLNVKTRNKPQTQDDFSVHKSKLDALNNDPFYISWNKGMIDAIHVQKNESTSIINLKKGISSLFQFQLSQEKSDTETDASGICSTKYHSASPTKLVKLKYSCRSPNVENRNVDMDEILGSKLQSSRQMEYELNEALTHLNAVKSQELHSVYLSAKAEIGARLEVRQELTFLKTEKVAAEETVDETDLDKQALITEVSSNVGGSKGEFSKLTNAVRDQLKDNVGSLKAAKAFLKLVNSGKSATKTDILKALQSKKNKEILLPLLDVLGYVQTDESHSAVTKVFHLDKEDHIDYNERYLWALSFSPHPNAEIVKDLLKKFTKSENIPDKVKETLGLTIASMARKLRKAHRGNFKVFKDAEEAILNGLDYAKKEEKYSYFRALKNLQSPSTIPVLLNYIRKGTRKEGVLAWKALRAFPKDYLDDTILTTAKNTIFQLDKKHDSSSRVLAVDILLESRQEDEPLLKDLLHLVVSNDTAYEVKQFVFQKINMAAAGNPSFAEKVRNIIKSEPKINNYSGLSPRGLSTALSRRFLSSDSSNGSLVSYQEIRSGIVKMGMVNVVMEKEAIAKEMFSLGIFSGGLHSLMSSNENEDGDEEEETATAGMELTVFDTQIRPFVFFVGQGELMGHVWSGTASEKTSAFQILALIQDHLEHLRLGSGFVAVHSLQVALSFDLSGKIEISLWNRNAESLIQKSVGVLINGQLAIRSDFMETQVDFNGNMESQLNLQSDIDFSSNMKACMRLTQPDTNFRYNVIKSESIPGTKYNFRISKNKKTNIPGITYALNTKNNEMCSSLFS